MISNWPKQLPTTQHVNKDINLAKSILDSNNENHLNFVSQETYSYREEVSIYIKEIHVISEIFAFSDSKKRGLSLG